MRIRNVSGQDRVVPELRRVVKADAVVDVPEKRAGAYTDQKKTWRAEPAAPHAKKNKE